MSAQPRPAASVILVKPVQGREGFEVLMLRRSSRSSFLPDMRVFPGGAVDPADWTGASPSRLIGTDEAGVAKLFRDTPGEGAYHDALQLSTAQRLGLFVTAFRELYEEAGVLLATDRVGEPVHLSADPHVLAQIEATRAHVASGEIPLATLLLRYDLWLSAPLLTYFSHWITPAAERIRFDAYFFIAVAHEDQQAQADASETHDHEWVVPSVALERHAGGTFPMIYPTVKHLERLAQYRTVEDLLAFARTKRIVTVMPQAMPGPTFWLDEPLASVW